MLLVISICSIETAEMAILLINFDLVSASVDLKSTKRLEAIHDLTQVNPPTCVGDGANQECLTITLLNIGRHPYARVWKGVSDGVREEVKVHLLEALPIEDEVHGGVLFQLEFNV